MRNMFDKLTSAINAISQGKPTVKPGKDWRALLASSLQAEFEQSAMNWVG